MASVIFVVNAPAWDSAFPFSHRELHLMGHEQPVWPIKVNFIDLILRKKKVCVCDKIIIM
jgi:hypothetical protein